MKLQSLNFMKGKKKFDKTFNNSKFYTEKFYTNRT